MIYLEPSLQKSALPTFHYALNPEGFLFLGASESIGSFTNLFEPVDKSTKFIPGKPRRLRSSICRLKASAGNKPHAANPDRLDLCFQRGKGREKRRKVSAASSQCPARGRPRHGQSLRSARRAHRCRLANPAISRLGH